MDNELPFSFLISQISCLISIVSNLMFKNMNIALIILAAGESKRMGVAKQLLKVEGETLLKRTLRTALDTTCFPIAVVVGANKAQIVPELQNAPITIIDNPAWKEGMAGSIKMGLVGVYMTQKEIDGVIFVTADMPYLSAEIVENLKYLAEKNEDKQIIAAKYANQLGIPALFKREIFNDLLDLKGELGAKSVIKKYQEKTLSVDFENGQYDIDTPEDYQNLLKNLNQK